MKILRVIASTNPTSGGPVAGLRQLTPVLSQWGHETEIVSLDVPGSSWLSESSIPIHACGPGITHYAYSPRLRAWLGENVSRFDCVIVHGLWQYHGLAVHQALKGRSIPYYVYTHGMLDPWFKHTYPTKHLKKWLFWPWGDYRVLRDAEAVLFTTEQERKLARESFWLYRCNERVVNYGAAEPPSDRQCMRELFLARYPELTDKRIILYMGRLHPKKGGDLLIQAFSEVASRNEQLHLVMAGPDEIGWAKSLQRLAEERDIANRVCWPGMLTGEAKWGALAAADVFALPSHQENFGIAVAEALACGIPVLISDKVNINQEVIDYKAGLVGRDNLSGTIETLTSWASLSAEESQVMSENARRCFEEKFEIQRVASSFIEVVRGNND